ncbi:putative membrane protein [Bacillus sp. RC251]
MCSSWIILQKWYNYIDACISRECTTIYKGDEEMIGEMKREALHSLKGKWGLGVGSTILYFILSYVVSMAAMLIMLIPGIIIFFLVVSLTGSVEEETMSIGAGITFGIFYCIIIILSNASYGITSYGYTNVFLQISKREGAKVDHLFEGFRGFKRMMKTMWAMLAILLYTGTWIPMLLVALFAFFGEEGNTSFTIAFFVLLAISIVVMIVMYFSYAMTYYVMIENPEYSVSRAMKESKHLMKGHKLDLFLLWLSFIGWGILAILTLGIGFLWLSPYMSTTTAHFYRYLSKDEL